MTEDPPDVSAVMDPLKDFQRRTAEYVFQRLYRDDDHTRRFLIADEAGLGKTLVAKGVIAQTIAHLWEEVDRIDVVYVCSNASIARQNVSRLVVSEDRNHTFPSRITLLPQYVHQLDDNEVNFVSFTPGTSFDLKSTLGRMQERVLLYHLLRESWDLQGYAPMNVLQGRANHKRYRQAVKNFDETIDQSLAAAFIDALDERPKLREEFEELCEQYVQHNSIVSESVRRKRRRVIGTLREVLANVCVEALEPDLIILDEFQRFKHLLEPDSSEGELARQLFEYSDEHSAARVLLLSATPYKMYTMAHERDENHLEDFLLTLNFLTGAEDVDEIEDLLEEYRESLYRQVMKRPSDVSELKAEIERRLRQVMVRTERLSASKRLDGGMLEEIRAQHLNLDPDEIQSYLDLEHVNELLEGPSVMEYWKSAPYLLTFMNDYSIKQKFRSHLEDDQLSSIIDNRLEEVKHLFLSADQIESYEQVDPRNARLRALTQDVIESGAWKCLWMPPSLSYYAPEQPFDDPGLADLTKRLVFSSWRVVPKTIAAMLSYEVERRIIKTRGRQENYAEGRNARGYLLRIAEDDGRLTGMPLFGLLYPSPTLADIGDPQRHWRAREADSLDDLEAVRVRVGAEIETRLQPIIDRERTEATPTGPRETVDERWYWLAPILLDLDEYPDSTTGWLDQPGLSSAWISSTGEDTKGDEFIHWSSHIDRLRAGAAGELALGPPPEDLNDVLTDIAIGGPATCALRALSRVVAVDSIAGENLRMRAAQTGWAFRSLFNLPETTALVRGVYPEEPYWRRILEYCCGGNLQAVLDEWVHMLDDFGLQDADTETVLEVITEQMTDALSLRTATVNMDEAVQNGDRTTLRQKRLRCHFALPFGQGRDIDTDDVIRADQVRRAFNSPLWPFMLATTSVGQEGLDFHPYCHAVVHWNLPSNPVDLEQRDGRVNRFKGHAIRKNIARGLSETARNRTGPGDVWQTLFDAAESTRDAETSELVPYWVFANGNGRSAKVERYVPLFALSREEGHLDALKRSLVLYRMAFGQSRQEDLVHFLGEHLDVDDVTNKLGALQIDLSPPS